MKLYYLDDDVSVGIVAQINSIAVVPVPGVGWLIGPLLGALAWRRPGRVPA